MTNILADENIPYVEQAFATLGKVKTMPGRLVCNADLLHTDILLVRSITQVNAELLKGSAVKFVASATSGINHIDLGYLKQKNIGFSHALGSNAISVAQYVTAGICHWSQLSNKPLDQISLGIIGYGHVGKQLEKLAIQLGINCVLNDPPLSETGQSGLQDIKSAMACDVVSLHVPYSQQGKHATDHLINNDNIQSLQPNALFINTSRGGVVEEKALLAYKFKHPQFQIILDVWENEPSINLEMLSQTLLATAHIAGYSFDGKLRGTEMIYQACCQFFNITPQWSTNKFDFDGNQPYDFKFNKYQDTRTSILKAYDIIQDSNQLMNILTNHNLKKEEHFDCLRKHYSIRREWINLV